MRVTVGGGEQVGAAVFVNKRVYVRRTLGSHTDLIDGRVVEVHRTCRGKKNVK